MRIYELIDRRGQVRKSLWPWFKSPTVGEPFEYYGWKFGPDSDEWEIVQPEVVKIQPDIETKEMPDWVPGRAVPNVVEGWVWSDSAREWYKVPVPRAGHYEYEEYPVKPEYVPSTEWTVAVRGWYFDNEKMKWVMTGCELKKEWIPDPHPAKPVREPGDLLPDRVIGWYWNYDVKKWLQILYAEPVYEFYPPVPPPPVEAIGLHYGWHLPWAEQLAIMRFLAVNPKIPVYLTMEGVDIILRTLKDMGLTDAEITAFGEAWSKSKVGLVLSERQKLDAKVAREVVNIWQRSKGNPFRIGSGMWSRGLADLHKSLPVAVSFASVLIVAAAVAAFIGIIIGYILAKLLKPGYDFEIMTPAIKTYLIGPEDWTYAKLVGTNVYGQPIFSACDGIGTMNVKHYRDVEIFGSDVISFIGGFKQSGYKMPYYVKYRWDRWLIRFIGVARSHQFGLYSLKVCHDYLSPYPPGFLLDVGHWCEKFEYYI